MATEPAQLRVRLPEPLHAKIEESARRQGQSLNAEVVGRLDKSFSVWGQLDIDGLKHEVREAMRMIVASQSKTHSTKPEDRQALADDLSKCAYKLIEISQLLDPKPRRNMAVTVDMPSLEEMPRGGKK